jgi:uncharacterized protein
LFYAYGAPSREHEKARTLIQTLFSGTELVGLPWQNVAAFLRISTNTRIAGHRLIAEAAQEVDTWLKQSSVRMLTPSDDYWAVLRRMVVEGQAGGVLVSDAEIAALTIEYGGVLYTADRDFARFPGLGWKNPLE